jgi:hypothetical protein
MTTVTLTEFLLARIAEDEAAARGLNADLAREFGTCETQLYSTLDSVGTGYSEMPALSIDSTRVLAECEAKRRIVEMGRFSDSPESAVDYWLDEGRGLTPSPGLGAMIDVLRLLALPYADHPDYDEAWRP